MKYAEKTVLLCLSFLFFSTVNTKLSAQTETCFFLQPVSVTAATCTKLGEARVEVFFAETTCPCLSFPTITCHLTNSATMAAYTRVFNNVTFFPFVAAYTDLPAGTYLMSVTTANGNCYYPWGTQTGIKVVVPLESSIAFTTPGITATNCLDSSDGSFEITASGGVPPYDYTLSNGQSKLNVPDGQSVSFTGLAAGTYTLEVLDANGCPGTSILEIPIGNNAAFNISETIVPKTCRFVNDGSIALTVSGGGPGSLSYTYNWSNGANTATVTGLDQIVYTVTVSSSAGCSTTRSYSVPGPATGFSWGAGWDDPCYNKNNGKIFVNANGGWGGFTYLWSNGTTDSVVNNLAPGTYTVTITDQGGCSVVDSYVIESQGGGPVSFATTAQRITSGEAIEITMNGGVNAFKFIWFAGQQLYATAGQVQSGTWNTNDGAFTQILESTSLRYPGQVEILVAPEYFAGCYGDTVTFVYEVLPNESGIFIPDIYTPNGDGQTDTWTISLPNDFQNAQVTVYNRAGAKVYEGSTAMPWDGSNSPDGPYFYVIQYTQTGQQKMLKGAVTILRTN